MAAVARDSVEQAVAAIRRGAPVLLPADTVYGLCGNPHDEAAVRRAYRLKRREATQATAVLAASVDRLFALLPELDGRSRTIVRTLLPGPYTLVLPDPVARFPWLGGTNPGTIGVRVADVPAATRRVLDAVGCVFATSANEPGLPPATRLDEVPAWIRAGCEAEVDAGGLGGIASTVLDFSGAEPRVLRDGAAPAGEAIARVAASLSS